MRTRAGRRTLLAKILILSEFDGANAGQRAVLRGISCLTAKTADSDQLREVGMALSTDLVSN